MSVLPRFLTRMDASAQRSIVITLALFGLVIAIFLVGKTGFGLNLQAVEGAIASFSESPFAPLILIAIFSVAAFLGAPQFGLIAMAVAVFGPWQGMAYSWVATMISGAVTFWVGRLAGEETFRRYAGNMANRMSSFIGRNAFTASALVRNVPTGPFLVVNMAFGISKARFLPFWAGMAIGIVPKIALVAFAGQSLIAALRGSPWIAVAAAIAAGGLWIAVMLYARRRVRGEIAPKGQVLAPMPETEIDTDDQQAN